MVWPGDDIVYEWSQTSNPVSESVEGYEAISVPFTGRYWGGLEPSTAALMDGSVNSGYWFYAVGSHGLWNGGIPSYAKSHHDAGYPQQAVELYVNSPVESTDDADFSYVRVTANHGTCEDNGMVRITTKEDCTAAAAQLGLPTGSGFASTWSRSNVHGGCIYELDQQDIDFNSNVNNNQVHSDRQVICKSMNAIDLVVTQIGDHERCREGHWLNVFPSSALECAYIVSNNPSCDNRYFSWANYNDNNCWCVEVGTDCKNNLASQNVVTTWEISTVSSKVINYGECTTINSVPGPPHEFDPENWNTKCPENTAVVSVETKDLEAHNGFWSIVKMRCCALVDKITESHYRLPEMQTIAGPNYLRGGGSSSVEDQWEAQCAPNAIMVGIYDDDDSGDFDDIDAAKCNTLECPYTCGEKIDNHDCVIIDLSPASLSSCPIDYVMVGLWDNAETNFDCVRK
eukprot:UN22374